ncbi:MAG: kynureninase [Solirubrobacterales bacterium]
MENMSLEYARSLDNEDKLRKYRDRFYLKESEIYMDGNSLGLLSKDAEDSLLRVLNEWKNLGINGWGGAQVPWFYFAENLAKLQAPLMGALDTELIIHSSSTINLHSILNTFYRPSKNKYKIMIDSLNFPTDRYAVESHLKSRDLNPSEYLAIIESKDGNTLDEDYIISQMSDDTALILLPGVLYRSGQLINMERLTAEAHKKDIIIGFDCCHSAGSVPHELNKWNVDFAFWCNYKHFNNGPGGTASLYINEKHLGKGPGMAGWFGYEKSKQFDLAQEFVPANTAGAWQVGTPHLLSMAPLEGSLKLFNEAGMENIREKSLKLTSYLMMLIENNLSEYGFKIGTPKEEHKRGGHVALQHDDAVKINEVLKKKGVLPDFRYPDVIRLAPVSLYTSFEEVWRVVDIIKAIMISGEYKNYSSERGTIA